jgi:hypothetical protein
MPAEAMTWTVTSTNMTSPRLRLSWKIRKSNYLNTYLITASMTNLDASINQVSGIAPAARATAYNAGTNYFLMGQPAEAYSSNKFSTTEIWIDKMSITNTADAAAVLVPSDVTANALNALVKLTWPICYEAEKLDIYRSSTSATTGFVALATNLAGGGISYNDSTVLNGGVYYYKVVWRANGSADAVSEVVDAEPNLDVTGVVLDTSFTSTNYVAGDLAGQKKMESR